MDLGTILVGKGRRSHLTPPATHGTGLLCRSIQGSRVLQLL